jgi:glc operon protein GlcG
MVSGCHGGLQQAKLKEQTQDQRIEENPMSSDFVMKSLVVVIYTLCVTRGLAQAPNPYGSPISLEDAKKVAAPALEEARKNNWTVAVALVDTGGILVYFEKTDTTQIGSSEVAIGKARAAVLFKRPTKAFQDTLAAGGDGFRVLGLQGAVPIEGGNPLLIDGKIVGAIGVSGVTSQQDGQCAKSGAEALK